MPISVMLKPASSACNLRCKYCFYSSIAQSRTDANKGMMTLDTAKSVIKNAFEFTKGGDVYFTFQGGEPLLRGLEFFEEFTSLCNQLNIYGSKLSICVQTNGTLIDDEWCRFFKKHNILVGVSLDGDEELNDYRVYPDGSNSFNDIMQGIELLKKYDVAFNVLSVLTKRLANNVRTSYRFFKQNDLRYLQYIPCLKPFDSEDNEYSMSNEDYSEYLNRCFKIYYNDKMRGNFVSVRQLDNYVLLANGQNAEQCGMNGPCSTQFVVEGDGSVYPCDCYGVDEWCLGNINESDFDALHRSEKSVEFLKESFKIKDECKTCRYFAICRAGGCKRNRASYDYCSAYKSFFDNSLNMVLHLKGV